MTETHPSPIGAGTGRRPTASPEHAYPEQVSPRQDDPVQTVDLPSPGISVEQVTAVQDRLAAWLSDFAGLHEHTEQLAATRSLDAVLRTVLDAGAALLGARRGMLVLDASHGDAVGLGLDRSCRGALETVPRDTGPYAGLLAHEGRPAQLLHTDLARDPGLDPRYRAVAAQLGIGASCALPLATADDGPIGAAVWFYDEPAEPSDRQQHLARLYCAFAAPVVARELELERLRRSCDALRHGLLPDRLPRVPGVRLAARFVPAGLDRSAGSDWYDALALPEGALALTVGSVCGGGTGAATAMGRLRAALRAYAVLEGEDPVAVLGDLELLLKSTEPARSATALYAYVEPAERRISLAGAGQCPPLLVTERGAGFVETSLSAPLGMLGCWEAPGVELHAEPGDVLVLYTEGLARRCGAGGLDAGQARLRAAAAGAPRDARQDPDRLCAHLLATCPDRPFGEAAEAVDDLVLLAVRFG
ncbi:PP2C family protein-serine/threonine phosphatase [Peterkaempfera bronchialis]|nr:GAF domain-containing SpoIIE family protein phosphatase [Peterkaempfera bronchialis]